MRAPVVLILMISCAARQETAEIQKIRAGETPANLKDLTDDTTLGAIADQIRKGKPASEPVKLHLCVHAKREHAEALFVLIEKEPAKVAYAAIFALADVLDEKLFPNVEGLLDSRTRETRQRALVLLTTCRMAGAAPLLEKRQLLDPKEPETSKVALGAMAAVRARGCHEAILDYYEKSGDELALTALGRIWERKLSAPALARADEIKRLTVLVVLQKLCMSGGASELSCDAMLRVMTRSEFEDFLKKFAEEKFFSRDFFSKAAGADGFGKEKGKALHVAFLASPDPATVAWILYASRFELPEARVRTLLENVNETGMEGLPSKTLVCDLAACRLEAQSARTKLAVPEKPGDRAALVAKWKSKK